MAQDIRMKNAGPQRVADKPMAMRVEKAFGVSMDTLLRSGPAPWWRSSWNLIG